MRAGGWIFAKSTEKKYSRSFLNLLFFMIYFESSINVDLVVNVPSGYYHPAPFHYVLRASTQIQIM